MYLTIAQIQCQIQDLTHICGRLNCMAPAAHQEKVATSTSVHLYAELLDIICKINY